MERVKNEKLEDFWLSLLFEIYAVFSINIIIK